MFPQSHSRAADQPIPSKADAKSAGFDVELARFAKALGHPARVRIIRFLLAHNSCMCGDIVEHLPLAQSTVSQHLKMLKDAGLIRGSIDGPRVCYCVEPAALTRLQELIANLSQTSPEDSL
jgi:ArsR family transcriptional regulator